MRSANNMTAFVVLFTCRLSGRVSGAVVPERNSVGGSPGRRTWLGTVSLFWLWQKSFALLIWRVATRTVSGTSWLRLFALSICRWRRVSFTTHGHPTNRCASVWYIYAQRYRDHHDEEFIRRCERVRRRALADQRVMRFAVVSFDCAWRLH